MAKPDSYPDRRSKPAIPGNEEQRSDGADDPPTEADHIESK